MNTDLIFDNIFWIIAAIVVGTFLWKMFRHGGFRAAVFGSAIEATVGEIQAEKLAMHSHTVRIYRLAGGSEGKAVGVELVSKGVASYQMVPITLSADAARALSDLLRSAASGSR
jgi:hypothetical protein